MKTRLLTALVMLPVVVCAIVFLPTSWLAALAALVLLAALREWYVLLGIRGLESTALLVGNLLLMALMVWAAKGSLALFKLGVLTGVVFWLLASGWLRFSHFGARGEPAARTLKRVAATLAIVPAWAALTLLHMAGPLWLLTALGIVWAADSGGYFVGRARGRRKLAPSISPNKTMEGAYGGLAAALMTAIVLGAWAGARTPGALGWLALVALVTAAASIVGDLFESLIKRHAGVKDSSQLIPGHGGLLDRMDGVFAALPVFALGKEIFGF